MTVKKKIRVLVVDDEQPVVDLVKMKLNLEGMEVIEAFSGEEALIKVRQEEPDLVLLDILMPGMSGMEVLKKMKEEGGELLAPVIFLSNSGREEEIDLGRKLGAVDYVVKAQLSLEDLVEKIEKIIKKQNG